MASSENQQQTPNPAPLSPSAGGHESRDSYLAQNATRPLTQKEPYLTPYLGLRARLSQTWINRWSILLLLVLFRTIFSISSLNDDIATAKREALSACTAVEDVGSTLASMPYYMSSGINTLVGDGIDKAVEGLKEFLLDILSGVEEIVVYVINMMTSTYLCLITLAITGALDVAIEVAEDVGNFLNSTAQDVGKDLGGAETDFQNAMNSFLKDLDDIGSWLTGKNLTPPTINLSSSIQTLDSLQLPAGYDADLEKLNSSIPTFSQVQNLTTQVIEYPFQEVEKLLNETFPTYKMNVSIFPVPAKEQLSFCSTNSSLVEFFEDLVEIADIAEKVFLAVLIIGIVAAMAPMAYRELRSWRFMKQRANLIQTGGYEPMDAVYLVSRPYTSSAGLWLSRKFGSSRRQALVRWTVAYATTLPALFVLSLAVASILACICQYVILKIIAKEVPVLENEIIDFADEVINTLNNASEQWTTGINDIMNDTSTTINNDLLGWVNTTTGAVNNTLNVFVNDTMAVLNSTFGGTILYTPILDVLNCLVLMKIQGIEKGLTWVSDHAYVDFPQIPNNTFSLDTIAQASGASSILNTSSSGGVADDITTAVDAVINALEKAVNQELILALCLLLIWVFIAIIGLIRAIYLLHSNKGHLSYAGALPKDQPPVEKVELDDLMHPAAPSYEQATRSLDPANNAANQYKGQTYTLTPNPIPTFNIVNPKSPTVSMIVPDSDNTKLGTVNGQNVDSAIRRPTHLRASSHGNYDVTSPVIPSGQNPFLSVKSKHDPFADPHN